MGFEKAGIVSVAGFLWFRPLCLVAEWTEAHVRARVSVRIGILNLGRTTLCFLRGEITGRPLDGPGGQTSSADQHQAGCQTPGWKDVSHGRNRSGGGIFGGRYTGIGSFRTEEFFDFRNLEKAVRFNGSLMVNAFRPAVRPLPVTALRVAPESASR